MRGSCSGAEIRDAHAGGYDDPVRGGCYLNIGEQHLFRSEGNFFYERHKRLGPPAFVEFEGDESGFAADMASFAGFGRRDRQRYRASASPSAAAPYLLLCRGSAGSQRSPANDGEGRVAPRIFPPPTSLERESELCVTRASSR
jgi:hypothetical protein